MRIYSTLLALTTAMVATVALAQGVELSRADRLAILYTPRLGFATSGEPLIKIGLVENVDRIEFEASTPVTVLPLGEGGPEVIVPADTRYTVTMSEGQAGTYTWAVVVAELTPAQRGELNGLRELWAERGLDVTTAEVGATFAVSGQQFNTRRTLVLVGETSDQAAAVALELELEQTWGIDARVHGELDAYPGGTLTLSGAPAGVTIRHRDLLWVRGDEDTVFTVFDVPYDVGTIYEDTETRRYVGSLIFAADKDGRLALVNETSAERIVAGVVPAEVYPDAPAEALRAQAVAARSWLLTDLGVRHLAAPYMTCSDQRCQMYRGIDYERPSTSAAVASTRGQVLTDGDVIIKTYYSSNNGGFSASNAWTWGESQRPYLTPRVDAPDAPPFYADGLDDEAEVRRFLDEPPDAWSAITSFGSGRTFRWSTSLDANELNAAVDARYPNVTPVEDIVVHERSPSGRISRLEIIGRRGIVIVERELNIRRALGGLRSALFVFELENDGSGAVSRMSIDGGGFGHGVGMCQSGAIGLAEHGWEHEAILAHYYPGTELRALY